MIHDDWPLWGDAGDLFRADPIGHIAHIYRTAFTDAWNLLGDLLGIPNLPNISHILEVL